MSTTRSAWSEAPGSGVVRLQIGQRRSSPVMTLRQRPQRRSLPLIQNQPRRAPTRAPRPQDTERRSDNRRDLRPRDRDIARDLTGLAVDEKADGWSVRAPAEGADPDREKHEIHGLVGEMGRGLELAVRVPGHENAESPEHVLSRLVAGEIEGGVAAQRRLFGDPTGDHGRGVAAQTPEIEGFDAPRARYWGCLPTR